MCDHPQVTRFTRRRTPARWSGGGARRVLATPAPPTEPAPAPPRRGGERARALRPRTSRPRGAPSRPRGPPLARGLSPAWGSRPRGAPSRPRGGLEKVHLARAGVVALVAVAELTVLAAAPREEAAVDGDGGGAESRRLTSLTSTPSSCSACTSAARAGCARCRGRALPSPQVNTAPPSVRHAGGSRRPICVTNWPCSGPSAAREVLVAVVVAVARRLAVAPGVTSPLASSATVPRAARDPRRAARPASRRGAGSSARTRCRGPACRTCRRPT